MSLLAAGPILVTGTAGFIGFHLARRLLAEGFEVVSLDSINSYYDPRLKHARLDYMVQKATEMGVARLPVAASGTCPAWRERVSNPN